MGRVFEKRKHTMFARFDRMSKAFTKYGKEIAIAVKAGGPDPDSNAKLRVVIANAKSANMPKDRIEAAIKRSAGKDSSNYEEVNYEAMCMKGVGLFIETATDNPTRTVANIRMHLNRGGGELGKSGSLDYAFVRKSIFVIKTDNLNTKIKECYDLEFKMNELHILNNQKIVEQHNYQEFDEPYNNKINNDNEDNNDDNDDNNDDKSPITENFFIKHSSISFVE